MFQENAQEAPNRLVEISELRKAVEELKTQSGLTTLRNDPRTSPPAGRPNEHPLVQYFRLDSLAPSTNSNRPQQNPPNLNRDDTLKLVEEARGLARAPNATWDQQMTATVLEYYVVRERLPANTPDRNSIEAGTNMHITRLLTNVYGATEFISTFELYVKFLEDNPNARIHRNAAIEQQLLTDGRAISALMPYWGRVIQIHFLSLLRPIPAAEMAAARKALREARMAIPATMAAGLPTPEGIDQLRDEDAASLMQSISGVEGRLRNIVFTQTAEVQPPRHDPILIERILSSVVNPEQRKSINQGLVALGLTETRVQPIPARRVHAAYINMLVQTRRTEADEIITKAASGEIPPNQVVALFTNHQKYGELIMKEHLFGLQTTTAHMYAGTLGVSTELQQNPESHLKMFTEVQRDKIFAEFLQLMAATPSDPAMQKSLQQQREKSAKAMRNYITYMRQEGLQLRMQIYLVDRVYVQPIVTQLTNGINSITQFLDSGAATLANWVIWGPILAGFFPALRRIPAGANLETIRKTLIAQRAEAQAELRAVEALGKIVNEAHEQLEKSDKALNGPLKIIEDMTPQDVTNPQKMKEAQAALKTIAEHAEQVGKTVVGTWNRITVNMEHHAKTAASLAGAQNSLWSAYGYVAAAIGIVLGNYIYNRVMEGV